jgi:hypothetical protein
LLENVKIIQYLAVWLPGYGNPAPPRSGGWQRLKKLQKRFLLSSRQRPVSIQQSDVRGAKWLWQGIRDQFPRMTRQNF